MKKKVFFILIVLAVATVAIVTLISTQIALREEEEKMAELQAMRDALLADNERLEHELSLDVTDEYIIRIMRKLGYYFPGEKHITFTPMTEEIEKEEETAETE